MERAAHEEERRFYNLTGEKNALKYFSTEAKRGVKKTALEYFEKSTGVFNQKGMLTREEIEEMKVGTFLSEKRILRKSTRPKSASNSLKARSADFSKMRNSTLRIWI